MIIVLLPCCRYYLFMYLFRLDLLCGHYQTPLAIFFHFSVSINGSNSKMFVSGSCDSTARLWDARIASRAVHTFHGHKGDVNTVKFFPDGQRFGTGSDDGACRLFDVRTGHQLQVYQQQQQQQQGDNSSDSPIVTSMAFSISGRLLFAAYSNGNCHVWDTLVGKVSSSFSIFT